VYSALLHEVDTLKKDRANTVWRYEWGRYEGEEALQKLERPIREVGGGHDRLLAVPAAQYERSSAAAVVLVAVITRTGAGTGGMTRGR
jgi:hypothetical protein